MSARSDWSLGTRGRWALVWLATFLVQFALGRAGWSAPGPLLIVAALQCAIVLIPLFSLYRRWREVPVSKWEAHHVAWFLSHLLALAVAMHHLQALRALSARFAPHGLYAWAHWFSALLLTMGIPVALVSVVAAWMVARRRAVWRVVDVAAVVYGAAMLSFLCVLNGALHPLDRLAPVFGMAWRSLTCFILPVAMVGAALVLWPLSTAASRRIP